MASLRLTAVVLLPIMLLPASTAIGSPHSRSVADTIAFVSELNDGLWVTNTGGLVQRPVTTKVRGVYGAAWSPDGRRIAFVSSGVLYVVDANGSGLRKLPAKPLFGLTWSPDGRRIAYTGTGGAGGVQIYVTSIAGGAPKMLAPTVRASVLASWSPRGETIAFTSAGRAERIYTVQADGTRLRTLTRGAGDSFPSWSPDGRFVLFESYLCTRATRCGYEINTMRADGSMRRRLVHVPSSPGAGGLSSAWSPDGKRILFLHSGGRLGDDIAVMDADGKNVQRLTRDLQGVSEPAWSPDGRKVAYERARSIYVMSSNGSGNRRLVEFGSMPAWQPRP